MSNAATFVLSESGSTRATAYNWGNKSVRRGRYTHAVWLDAVATVCGRTYDHDAGAWGPTHCLGEGADNHANPSITMDRDGHVRMTWGPHGWWSDWNQGRVKWAKTSAPDRLDQWEPEHSFGYNATAASIIHSPRGVDMVVCRGGESPASLMFHRQRELGGFTSARELMRQEIQPQYTHSYGHVACGRSGVVYAGAHFYNVGGGDNAPVTGDQKRMRSYGAALLMSKDRCQVWTDLAGQPVDTPTLYDHRIAVPPMDEDVRLDSVALDSADLPWCLTQSQGLRGREVWVSQWTPQGWSVHDVADQLPDGWTSVDGVMTVDAHDHIHLALTALPTHEPEIAALAEGGSWGHPRCEVFHLCSKDDGATWTAEMVSDGDPTVANWLPTLPRFGPFHPVEPPFLLLWTKGEPGQGCSPETKTTVLGRFIGG